MKFYLSSDKLGNEVQKLKKLFPKGKKVAYIPNALDYSNDLERRERSEQTDIEQLKGLGLNIELVDLCEYFHKKIYLEKELNEVGAVWVGGGNTFVLRQAMKLSGFEDIIKKLSTKKDFLYGGYSAGICILAPTLRGIHLMDDVKQKPYGKQHKIIWKGLGLINCSIVPHYNSDHPESQDANKSVKYLKKHKMPFKTLRDGEVIIITPKN